MDKRIAVVIGGACVCFAFLGVLFYAGTFSGSYSIAKTSPSQKVFAESTTTAPATPLATLAPLDVTAYNAKLNQLANNPSPKIVTHIFTASSGVTSTVTSTIFAPSLWPVKTVLP